MGGTNTRHFRSAKLHAAFEATVLAAPYTNACIDHSPLHAKVAAPPRTLRALRREEGEEGAPASPSSLRMQYCCPLDPAW